MENNTTFNFPDDIYTIGSPIYTYEPLSKEQAFRNAKILLEACGLIVDLENIITVARFLLE